MSTTTTKILFIGNSYTHGAYEPAISFNKDAIHDLDGTGSGGVPGLFKALTDQAGLDFDVTIEAVDSATLQSHYEERAAQLRGVGPWDIVFLQEQSALPIPSHRGGDPDRFAHGAKNILALVREKSPGAKVYFYETWARPDKVYLDGASYRGEGLRAMQTDLHDSYLGVASLSKALGLVLVGQSFLKAIEDGVAVVSPYNEIEDGKVDLWAHDHFHASKYGSYLSACTFFAAITGEDPTIIANGDGSPAASLRQACGKPAASLGVEQEVATSGNWNVARKHRGAARAAQAQKRYQKGTFGSKR